MGGVTHPVALKVNITVIADFASPISVSYTFFTPFGARTFLFLGHKTKLVSSPLKMRVGSDRISVNSSSSKY